MKLLKTLGLLTCVTAVASTYADEYQSLFDGESLEGWHILEAPKEDRHHATTENFFAKDGALHCYQLPNRKGGLLLTDQQFKDFELIMDIKSDWGCDSGIFLRCNEHGAGIQILNDYLKDGSIGFPFGQGTGGFISRPFLLNETDGKILAHDKYDAVEKDNLVYAMDAAGWNTTWKPGEWNTIKIRCVGEEPIITTWINGVKVMEMNGSTYTGRGLKHEIAQNWDAPSAWKQDRVQDITGGKGSIAVQIHQGGRWKQGGAAMYRNIKIKELN